MSDKEMAGQRLRDFDFSDFILRSELEDKGERHCLVPDYEPTARKVKRTRKYKKSFKSDLPAKNSSTDNNKLVA
jgi:hypothetical protein